MRSTHAPGRVLGASTRSGLSIPRSTTSRRTRSSRAASPSGPLSLSGPLSPSGSLSLWERIAKGDPHSGSLSPWERVGVRVLGSVRSSVPAGGELPSPCRPAVGVSSARGRGWRGGAACGGGRRYEIGSRCRLGEPTYQNPLGEWTHPGAMGGSWAGGRQILVRHRDCGRLRGTITVPAGPGRGQC